MYKLNSVQLGSSGLSVFILQAMLRAMQYLGTDGKPLEIDGIAGKNTAYAIINFQRTQIAYGYDCGTKGKPNGIFGKKCWSLLLGE